MRDIFTPFPHAIVIVIRLGRPGGLRSVVAESVLMRHQVLMLNRGRKRPPNLRASDRIIAGLMHLNDGSGPGPAIRHRPQAFHFAAFS